MASIASAYGIPSFTIEKESDLDIVRRELQTPGATLFDVRLDPSQEFEPRLRSRILADGSIRTPELEDMYPFLSPEELTANMPAKEDE
jgi:acetolactate synthase-1/2/3 large subunit